jgi:AcrR family transcriptional regulator
VAKTRASRAKRKGGRRGAAKAEARVVAAALDLIAERGWRSLTLDDVARRAGMDLAAVRALFPKRDALLEAFFREVDRKVAAEGTYSADDPNPARDRLFDVLMRRFDALNAHRGAMVALTRDLPFDPKGAAQAACRLCRSLKGALKTAGLSPQGPLGCLRLKGLIVIYLNALRVWLSDETSDLSPTMAALDKGLRAAESAMAALGSLAPGAPGGAGRPNQRPGADNAAGSTVRGASAPGGAGRQDKKPGA